MVDIELVYNLSIHKLQNFQSTRRDSDGLRKLVLLNNFVYEKFVSPEPDVDLLEWSEEDIKKDEESWLESCLDELDEDDYVHVNVKPFEHQPTVAPFPIDRYDDPGHYEDHYVQDDNAMEYENLFNEQQQLSKDNNVIIPHDVLYLPFFEPNGNYNMDIEEQDNNNNDINNNINNDDSMDNCNSSSQDDDIDMTNNESFSENLSSEKGFHPYWKDNSIIDHPPSRSFGIPKIFHKYRFDQDINSSSPRRISLPNAVLELLQSNDLYQSLDSPLRRSKDDLDMLYSLAPKDLDRGILMDIISMLEYNGGKTNHDITRNSSEINDMWFMDNNHR